MALIRELTMESQTPYTVADVAGLTALSERTVTEIFENEKGVIIYEVVRTRGEVEELPGHPHPGATCMSGSSERMTVS
jgi:hypothetical protein